MTRVGFTTIVKNEATVIERALESVRSIVDYVLISDTGSEDGTPQIIRSWLARSGMPGEVIERPWIDFSHNRNEALERLRSIDGIDYALTIDADEYLVFDPAFGRAEIKAGFADADIWEVVCQIGSEKFIKTQVFSTRMPIYYRHKMHEELVPPAGSRRGRIRGFINHYTFEGARMRNPSKYLDDARVMEAEFANGDYDDPAARQRATQLLAQCYRDAKLYEKARDTYLYQATLGGAPAQAAWSFYRAALLMEHLEQPVESIVATHLKSFELAPFRAEPLAAAARIANINHLYQQAYLFAKAATALDEHERLPIDVAAYEWRALDELLTASIGTHRFDEAVEVAERLLSEAKFPESERQRIEQNAAYALAQYELAPVIGPDAKPVPAN